MFDMKELCTFCLYRTHPVCPMKFRSPETDFFVMARTLHMPESRMPFSECQFLLEHTHKQTKKNTHTHTHTPKDKKTLARTHASGSQKDTCAGLAVTAGVERIAKQRTVSSSSVRPSMPNVGVQGSGFRVQGSGFRVQGSGFRVQGSGFRV